MILLDLKNFSASKIVRLRFRSATSCSVTVNIALFRPSPRAREEAIERMSNVQMNLAESPWAHLIWNPLSRRMITRGPPKRAAERILYYSVGGDLSILNSSPEELREDIAAIQNVDISSIALPMFI